MKFIGYTSAICLTLVGALEYANAAPQAKPVYMTSQIQRLLNEKQEKMSKLEECDGKRKGFMIAGISTIGLTAVGIGVNIAQASKSNKLSNQIEDQNRELDKQQANLANINSQISDIQNDNRHRECESSGKVWINGQCVDKPENQQGGDQSGGNQTGGDQTGGGQLGGGLSDYDGIIGQPCTDNGDGSVWTAEGDKKCLSAEGSTDIVACSCRKPGETPVGGDNPGGGGSDGSGETPGSGGGTPGGSGENPVSTPDRIIGKPCKAGDLPANATAGYYALDGGLQCLKAEGSSEIVNCQCITTECNSAKGYSLRNGKCILDNKEMTSDCIEKGKKYFADHCVPCLNVWNLMGEDICKDDIDPHKGYDKITIVNEEDGTEFKIFAKDGHSDSFSCGSACTKKGGVTTEACQASGGRGLNSAGQCLCDWVNNGNSQRLRRGTNGLCECQSGFERIDPNNLKLGCVSKAFSQDLQNYKKAVEQFDKKYSEVDTAVSMVKQSMESIEKARSLEDVNKYGYKTGLDTWMSATKKRVTEATNLYNQAVAKYNGLSAEDQAKTKTDATLPSKATLDSHKNEVNNALHEAEGYAQRAQTAYDKLLKDEEDRNAGIDVAERQRMNSCIDSHGQWDGKKCSCARDRGLKLSYDECECINMKWEWCPEKNACRPSTDC